MCEDCFQTTPLLGSCWLRLEHMNLLRTEFSPSPSFSHRRLPIQEKDDRKSKIRDGSWRPSYASSSACSLVTVSARTFWL